MPSNHLILFHPLLLLLSVFPSARVFSTELILSTFTVLLTTRLLGKIPQLIMLLICWGECAVSSVLPHCTKNLKWQTSVTAWLQLSFIWQAKEHTSLRGEAGWPKEERGSVLLLLLSIFSPPLSLPCVKWAGQKCCLFYLTFSLWSSDFLSFLFLGLFLFCLLAIAILDSIFLF